MSDEETTVPSGAFASFTDAAIAVEDFREQTAQAIIDAAEKSSELSRGQKRRIQRVMRGDGRLGRSRKNRIIDEVSLRLYADEMIVVTPLGVEAAVDWDSILVFIEKLIPLIIQLIGLFGG